MRLLVNVDGTTTQHASDFSMFQVEEKIQENVEKKQLAELIAEKKRSAMSGNVYDLLCR